ncbi:PDZ domain-containing protein [Streptomyces sp. NPDC059534]|uniref:PDZ domain-containing protein n=1 Tax=Streptomyces sp. NPDC059534 TaxID=3346859 RepID=UPI0036C675B4
MSQGYLRFPSIAGDTIVFCCEDDLWTVGTAGGTARRLTAGVAEAARPLISPDGAQVAFVGADEGPTEVYVMPLDGGPARRLTHQAAQCHLVGWDRRTGEILYAGTGDQPAGFGHRLFAVHPDGGPPRLLPYGSATALTRGPDGRAVLCRNGTDPARWKRYRGGAAGELWIETGGSGAPGSGVLGSGVPGSGVAGSGVAGSGALGPGGPGVSGAEAVGPGGFRPLVSLPGNLAHPCHVGERVYFVSDQESTGNVHSCRTDGTDLRRHTHHRDFYVRHLATDGVRLVYQAGARLHLLEPGSEARPVDIELTSSRTQRGRRLLRAAERLDTVRLSPDGATLAVASRGKAFTLAPWSGPVRQHGRPDGVRYQHLDWLRDGRRLAAVAGDSGPRERLVVLDTADGTETDLAVGDVGQVTELAASPRADLVAFATNRQKLYVVDVATASVRLLDETAHDRIEDLAWSPDGRWLAYTYPDTPRTSAIKVADVPAGTTRRITRPVLRDMKPAFDPDGRHLYFIGQRALTPEYDQVEAEVGFPFGTLPYAVTLREGTPAPFVPRPEDDDAPEGPDGEPAPVVIDMEGIERRVVPFPVPESRYIAVLGLPGKALLWSVPLTAADPLRPEDATGGQVCLVDMERMTRTECLVQVDDLHVRADDDVLLYRCGSRLRVLRAGAPLEIEDDDDSVEARPGRASGWIDLDRIRVPLRPAEEWHQMFREAWRLQKENFWHAGMAGVDWDAVYERYAPLVDLVATRSELSDLIWESQGELGASHAYERGGDYREPPHHAQGFLGIDWDTADPKAWRVGAVLEGDPWNPAATSPCNRPGTDIRPGDTVVAVNGRPVGPQGPGELLVGLAGHEVELSVRRGDAEPRRICVRAAESETPARYRDWVEDNRRHVHEASGGRLGYIHVPDMFLNGYTEFVRGFATAMDRPGLVLDVRYNIGGHISPLLLERLARHRLGAEHGRWSGVRPYPSESPAGPMALLVNEHTGSDGEIFSHTFRELGLGPLIGHRTWGGVIATWPRQPLVDGTVTTQPEFRYVFDGVGGRLENRGVEPDVVVVVPPGPADAAADPQLAAAVGHLLARLDGQQRPSSPGAETKG